MPFVDVLMSENVVWQRLSQIDERDGPRKQGPAPTKIPSGEHSPDAPSVDPTPSTQATGFIKAGSHPGFRYIESGACCWPPRGPGPTEFGLNEKLWLVLTLRT